MANLNTIFENLALLENKIDKLNQENNKLNQQLREQNIIISNLQTEKRQTLLALKELRALLSHE